MFYTPSRKPRQEAPPGPAAEAGVIGSWRLCGRLGQIMASAEAQAAVARVDGTRGVEARIDAVGAEADGADAVGTHAGGADAGGADAGDAGGTEWAAEVRRLAA